jgi:hypothetical protein
LSLLWAVAAVVACDEGKYSEYDRAAPPTPTSSGSAPPIRVHPSGSLAPAPFAPGHILAYVTLEGVVYEWSGLLTSGGELRLRVEGPPTIGSLQLVGALAIDGSQASGSGVVIAQRCALPSPSPFCADAATWRASLNMISPWVDEGADGEIIVTTKHGEERWPVHTGYWGGQARFALASGPGYPKGLYKETVAEFATGHDVILDFDGGGRFFFQGWQTGCTGNGTLAPHGASNVNLFTVQLTVGGCIGAFQYLNRTFEGLSVIEPETPWDWWGLGPRMWLSTLHGEPQPVALTLWALPLE